MLVLGGPCVARRSPVFRAAESANCAWLPVPFQVDILSAAAQRLVGARRVAGFSDAERVEAEARKRGVLRAARAERGSTDAGAWGVGRGGVWKRSAQRG